jgi:hypothetical protein
VKQGEVGRSVLYNGRRNRVSVELSRKNSTLTGELSRDCDFIGRAHDMLYLGLCFHKSSILKTHLMNPSLLADGLSCRNFQTGF